jgi:hypothetical protein
MSSHAEGRTNLCNAEEDQASATNLLRAVLFYYPDRSDQAMVLGRKEGQPGRLPERFQATCKFTDLNATTWSRSTRALEQPRRKLLVTMIQGPPPKGRDCYLRRRMGAAPRGRRRYDVGRRVWTVLYVLEGGESSTGPTQEGRYIPRCASTMTREAELPPHRAWRLKIMAVIWTSHLHKHLVATTRRRRVRCMPTHCSGHVTSGFERLPRLLPHHH